MVQKASKNTFKRIHVIPAQKKDLPAIWQLYARVCGADCELPLTAAISTNGNTPTHAASNEVANAAGWILGIYPNKTDFEKRIAVEEFFIAQVDTPSGIVLAGAFGLDSMDDSDYAQASWKQQLHEDEVASIHMLAVLPEFRGLGVGDAMMRAAHCMSCDWGKKAIRLAVVKGNVAACTLYERHGFECVDTLSVYYESSGETPLLLFEKAL
ncbi:GNAT family N-acetyltransferase [Atopobium fossor]|uniref:GNAT family N-acetyltransferase n=1 Tax=Atopobium fossor TaxID=39487 RepID=UPI00041A6968|nr:N-acetyltransferase [Atopobium fossor]